MERNSNQRFIDDLNAGIGKGKVKVRITFDPPLGRVANEYLWARPIGTKYARLENVPAFARFLGYGDIVQVEPGGDDHHKVFVRLVKRGSWTHFLQYKEGNNKAETLGRGKVILERLEANGYWGEGVGPGLLAVGVPVTTTFHKALAFLDATPHLIDHSLRDMDPDVFSHPDPDTDGIDD
jgi:Domain of unknown function (DUF4265)